MATKIGFGGGCHWCTEAVFGEVFGVTEVAQGFLKSDPPYASWSEGVVVSFDDRVSLEKLIEIHLRTHASSSNHSMREKYRSAIYVFEKNQVERVSEILSVLEEKLEREFVTLVLEFVAFDPSEERFQQFYKNNPDHPFCRLHIEPKLAVLDEI